MDKQKGFLEETLAESQGKDVCRALFDGSPDAIFLADPKTGILLDANPAAERLAGRPLSEMAGRHHFSLYAESRQKKAGRTFSRHCEEDHTGTARLSVLRPDGMEVPVEISAKVIKIKGRKVLQGFFRDISARLEAETALRESEERYRSLVDHAPVGIAVHREGVIKFVNRRMAGLGGFLDPDRLKGRLIDDFLHPDSRGAAAERLAELAKSGQALPPAELKLVAADGRPVNMETVSIPISFQGETCVMTIALDVTARKRAQDELRESEERYRTLVNHAPVGIVVHAMGPVLFLNERMAEMIKSSAPAALLGRSVLDFIHPDCRGLVAERFRKATAGEALPPVEEKILAQDGSVIDAEVHSVPITYRGQACLLAMVQDIRERKRAQEEIARAQRQLLEANVRLEERVEERTSQLEDLNKELEAFSYSAAHDLKAPLRRINIFSDMLEREAGEALKDQTHDYLVNIHKSVTLMTRLVDALLSLSTTGRRPLELDRVDLGAVLEEAAAEVLAENPGRAVEWDFQALPAVSCDRAMLRQVFVNLLGNAVKYTRGRLPARVEVRCQTTAREHTVAVSDNGIGFSMEYADRIFGVFQRLHRSEDYEGTGIGLSTVKRIVTRHGGRAWAESEPDKGATFYFTIPALRDKPEK